GIGKMSNLPGPNQAAVEIVSSSFGPPGYKHAYSTYGYANGERRTKRVNPNQMRLSQSGPRSTQSKRYECKGKQNRQLVIFLLIESDHKVCILKPGRFGIYYKGG